MGSLYMRGTFSFCIFSIEFRFLSPFTLRNGLLKADRYSLGICQRAYSLHARTVLKEIIGRDFTIENLEKSRKINTFRGFLCC